MVTLAEAISDVRTEMHSVVGVRWNELTAAGADDEDLTLLRDANGISPQSELCVSRTGESIHVWTRSGNSVNVRRGHEGTMAQIIQDGDLVEVAPTYSTRQIQRAVLAELRGLPDSLFALIDETHTITSGQRAVRLNRGDPIDVVEVRVDGLTTLTGTSITPRDNHPHLEGCHVERVGPDGVRYLSVPDIGRTARIYVRYAAPFDDVDVDMLTDLVDDVGLAAGMLDILTWGAMGTLLSGGEARRLDSSTGTQPGNRQQVPATAHVQVGKYYFGQRDMRIGIEGRRLQQRARIHRSRTM